MLSCVSAMNASSHQKQSFLQSWVNPNPNSKPSEDSIKKKTAVVNLGGGSEVLYIPRFIPPEKSAEWLRYLDTHIPWTRPSIHVFGRSCLQPRETCYVASKGLPDLKYSGYQPHAYSWDEYPILKDILKEVHETLPGSSFNSLLLNRYKNGADYVSWHSDDEKIYGPAPQIASLSLGCEREFLLRKRPTKAHTDQTPSKRRAEHLAGKQLSQRVEQHSFMLKHGSLLVMRGYTQRDWVHSVPKRAKADAVRINLTFRNEKGDDSLAIKDWTKISSSRDNNDEGQQREGDLSVGDALLACTSRTLYHTASARVFIRCPPHYSLAKNNRTLSPDPRVSQICNKATLVCKASHCLIY